MKKFAITNERRMSECIGALRGMFKEHGYVRVSMTKDKPRSLPQNNTSHLWYEQISAELQEGSPLDVKCECKLLYGVPILRAEDQEYREAYDATIKPMTYEQKLIVMKHWPVTSMMSTAQLSKYLDAMKAGYDGRVLLEFPNE